MSLFTILTLILFLTMAVLCSLQFIKVAHLYVVDGADLRTCFICQFFAFCIIFFIEVIAYFITGKHNQLCIFICKIYAIVAAFLYSSCKFIGKKSLFTSSLLKNVLYIITALGFFSTLIYCLETMTYTQGIAESVTPLSKESFIQASNFLVKNCFTIKYGLISPAFVEFFIPIYVLACSLICTIMDALEHRSVATRFSTFLIFFLGLIQLYFIVASSKEGTGWTILNVHFTVLHFSLPWITFILEANNVLYYANLKADDYDTVAKIVKKCSREKVLTEKSKAQARVVAKMIAKDPRLNEVMPLFTRSRSSFIDYVNDCIENDKKDK